MRLASTHTITASLLLSPLASCAAAMDATHNGHPIVETTIKAINDDPLAWESKWVRLKGLVDSKNALLIASREQRGIGINLNPNRHMQDGAWVSELGDPDRPAFVVGRVDLSCVNWFKQAGPGVTYAEIREGPPAFYHLDYAPASDGPLRHCAFVLGPYLADAVITKIETTQ